jgi:hypothetical protein
MRVTALIFTLAMVAACSGKPPTPVATVAQVEAQLLAKGQQLAAYDLKDPASAQFRAVFLQRAQPAAEASVTLAAPIVCGELNGRNSYGAYAGFRRFAVSLPTGEKIVQPAAEGSETPDLDDMAFRIQWTQACGVTWSGQPSASARRSASPAPG